MTNHGLRRTALAIAAVFLSSMSLAADSKVQVTQQGFCVFREDERCWEVALPDTSVDITRLPQLPDGTRVVYFYSDQTIDGAATFLHVLDSEDDIAGVEVVLPEGTGRNADALRKDFIAAAEKVGSVGAVTVTGFTSRGTGAKVRTFSTIPVTGPGIYSGRVVGIDGKPVPNSEKVSFTAIRIGTRGL
jgi:hypothetical protein